MTVVEISALIALLVGLLTIAGAVYSTRSPNSGMAALGKTIESLSLDNTRLSKRLEAAEKRITDTEALADKSEKESVVRYNEVERKLEACYTEMENKVAASDQKSRQYEKQIRDLYEIIGRLESSRLSKE